MPGMNAAKRKDLTPAEAAVVAGVTRSTIWRWRKAGRLPGAYETAGGHLRIPLEALAEALKERH
jgi:excisionase family DNA binding protein